MATLVVHPAARALRGSVPAPPDRDAGELALLLAALGDGTSAIGVRGAPDLALVTALRELGVVVERAGDAMRVRGVGPRGFEPPSSPLHAPSLAAAALLAGVLAAQPFESVIEMEQGLGRAVLHRATRPLRLRGASIEGRLDPDAPGVIAPPLEIKPASLSSLQYDLEPGDVAGKLAALASGLLAGGETLLHETVVCHDAPSRMLSAVGAAVESAAGLLRLRPLASALPAFSSELPGELDGSLLLLASALAVDGSHVAVRAVRSSPADAAALAVLRDGQAELIVDPRSERLGESVADVTAGSAPPNALRLAGEPALQVGVSLPALAAWAARASGTSEIADVPPPPHRMDQGKRLVACLHAFGVEASAPKVGALVVEGRARSRLRAADIDADGDADIAMLAAVLGLGSSGPCRIARADGIVARFPRFVGSLRALGARIEVQPA